MFELETPLKSFISDVDVMSYDPRHKAHRCACACDDEGPHVWTLQRPVGCNGGSRLEQRPWPVNGHPGVSGSAPAPGTPSWTSPRADALELADAARLPTKVHQMNAHSVPLLFAQLQRNQADFNYLQVIFDSYKSSLCITTMLGP
jgi:hypothetical protein